MLQNNSVCINIYTDIGKNNYKSFKKCKYLETEHLDENTSGIDKMAHLKKSKTIKKEADDIKFPK